MLRMILFHFWPTLIPTAIYWAWRFYCKKKKKKLESKAARKAFIRMVYATIVMLVVSFIAYFALRGHDGEIYIDSHINEQGEFVRGHWTDAPSE